LDFHPAAHRAQWREKLGDIAGAIEDWNHLLGSLEPLESIDSLKPVESLEPLESLDPLAAPELSSLASTAVTESSDVNLDQRIAAYRERGRLKRSLKDFPGSAADWREAARLLEEQGQEEEAQDILNQLNQGDEWGD
jgi:tetratricopeptide (TPR) repeat protein